MRKTIFCVFALIAAQLAVASDFSTLSIAILGSDGPQYPSWYTSVYGLRLGLLTARHPKMYGVSVCLFGNDDNSYSEGDICGLTIGGFGNIARSSEYGAWQVASLFNNIHGNANVLQCAAIFNRVGGEFSGVQVGLVNICEESMSGVQIGLFNKAGDMDGFQIGAFNAAESNYGFQIGLFNAVSDSQMKVFPLFRFGF